jgi:glycerol kinase
MAETGTRVRDILEKMGLRNTLTKLMMTGGAVRSREWPETIAKSCGLAVEAVRFDELTALGAALFARTAITGKCPQNTWPKEAEVCVYEP